MLTKSVKKSTVWRDQLVEATLKPTEHGIPLTIDRNFIGNENSNQSATSIHPQTGLYFQTKTASLRCIPNSDVWHHDKGSSGANSDQIYTETSAYTTGAPSDNICKVQQSVCTFQLI